MTKGKPCEHKTLVRKLESGTNENAYRCTECLRSFTIIDTGSICNDATTSNVAGPVLPVMVTQPTEQPSNLQTSEVLICPGCSHTIRTRMAHGLSDTRPAVCVNCKGRFTLGRYRSLGASTQTCKPTLIPNPVLEPSGLPNGSELCAEFPKRNSKERLTCPVCGSRIVSAVSRSLGNESLFTCLSCGGEVPLGQFRQAEDLQARDVASTTSFVAPPNSHPKSSENPLTRPLTKMPGYLSSYLGPRFGRYFYNSKGKKTYESSRRKPAAGRSKHRRRHY